MRVALACLLASMGCDGSVAPYDPADPRDPADPMMPVLPSLEDLTHAQAEAYLRRLAPILVRRTLEERELERIESDGGGAIRPMLDAWTAEPGFAEAARQMISLALGTSGRTEKIDLDLPGNLAAHLVREDLPYADILRAGYCVDAAGAETACDTGAPYAAGVLATRAFLTGNEGRFNLKRARTMMRTFACLDYPMEQQIQPSLEREVLLPMFRATRREEQEDVRALAGFGNGFGCYTCHSQFGAHAQLFVRFDREGIYHGDATGQQDPDGELGRSVNGLLTSHMSDPARASSEESQLFGEPVENLGDAARVLTASPVFLACSTRTVIGFGFALADSIAAEIPAPIIERIVAAALAREPEPTLETLAIEAFADTAVVSSIVGGAVAGGEQ
jgi:hypothetical protein